LLDITSLSGKSLDLGRDTPHKMALGHSLCRTLEPSQTGKPRSLAIGDWPGSSFHCRGMHFGSFNPDPKAGDHSRPVRQEEWCNAIPSSRRVWTFFGVPASSGFNAWIWFFVRQSCNGVATNGSDRSFRSLVCGLGVGQFAFLLATPAE
jgi:hypothetical protein